MQKNILIAYTIIINCSVLGVPLSSLTVWPTYNLLYTLNSADECVSIRNTCLLYTTHWSIFSLYNLVHAHYVNHVYFIFISISIVHCLKICIKIPLAITDFEYIDFNTLIRNQFIYDPNKRSYDKHHWWSMNIINISIIITGR